MKKRVADPDVTLLINGIQQQLASLDKKLDTLIGHSARKEEHARAFPKPGQGFDRPRPQADMQRQNVRPERVLHKAVCADCRKECEVPFRPSGDRPEYCKDCFSKRRAANQFKPRQEPARPGPVAAAQARIIGKSHTEIAAKPAKKAPARKKPAAKKKKK